MSAEVPTEERLEHSALEQGVKKIIGLSANLLKDNSNFREALARNYLSGLKHLRDAPVRFEYRGSTYQYRLRAGSHGDSMSRELLLERCEGNNTEPVEKLWVYDGKDFIGTNICYTPPNSQELPWNTEPALDGAIKFVRTLGPQEPSPTQP